MEERNAWMDAVAQLRAAKRIAFICVANSARSQMAEGIARMLSAPAIQIFSAGSEPSRVNRHAVEALAEIGIDISDQRSKSLDDIPLAEMDAVVVLCADEQCPVLPAGVSHIDWALPDPAGNDDEAAAFRSTRDELQRRLQAVFA
jgi:protein-tyrosine-phosphatase